VNATASFTARPDRPAELGGAAGPLGLAALAALACAAVCACLGLSEVGLGLCALAATVLFFRLSLGRDRPQARFLVLAWLIGQNLAWVVGIIGYYYLPKPDEFELGIQVSMSIFLANLSIWGVILGSLAVLPPKKAARTETGFFVLPEGELWRLVCAFGAVSLGYALLSLAAGALSARWSHLEAGSIRYYLDSVFVVIYCFYFFLGASMRPGSASGGNLARLGVLAAGLAVTGFSGSRAFGLRLGIYFLAGLIFSPYPLRRIVFGLARFIPIALVFTFVVGAARGGTNFAEVGLQERLGLMADALAGKLEAKGELQNYPVFSIFERLATPQGQVVIDDVVEKGELRGFLNFDRIATFFLPKVLVGDKKPADDGYERLIEHHNFRDDPGTSAPITFLADAFERGGDLWVFTCSFLLGAWLTVLGSWLSRLGDPCLRAILLMHCAIVCLEMYPRSVLGTLSAATYGLGRDAAIVLAVSAAGLVVWHLSGKARLWVFETLAKRLDKRA
jgi:hypothetical protein